MIMIVGTALYQWDTGRYVTTDVEADHIHFSNKGDSKAVIMDLANSQAKIPDYLLKTGKQLCVYVVRNRVTVESRVFSVTPRECPADYIYEEDQRNFVYALIADAQAATEAAKQAAKEATDVSDAIKKDAASGKFKGDKGEKGEKGDPGEQGPKGDPGDAGDTLNDRVISTEHSWSSKNTVDKLCPSFAVSGSVVVCEPVEGCLLSVSTTLPTDHAVSKITLYHEGLDGVGDEVSTEYTVDFGDTYSNGFYDWETGVLRTEDEGEMQFAPQVITAFSGRNSFRSNCGDTYVSGKADPNEYWAEKLAEQEAIIAEQEAELAKLNKQYELIEERIIIADTNKVTFDKDLSEVPYNFSAITVVVASTAASATAAVIFQPKDADKNYIFYHEHQNGLGTSARTCVFKARNDHGLCEGYSFSNHTGNANLYAERGYKGDIWRNVCKIDIATYPTTVLIPKDTVIKVYGIRG